MPRIRIQYDDQPRKANAKFVARLVKELKSQNESGQPFIYEQTFQTGAIRVLVIWDDWKDLSLEQRTGIILSAIEQSDGKEYRSRVALASGLTVIEGVAAGVLPYQVMPALRKGDPVTPQDCREAMLSEGASKLFGPGNLQLRFPTEQAAEACRQRLIKALPGSDEVWLVAREISSQDFGPDGGSIPG